MILGSSSQLLRRTPKLLFGLLAILSDPWVLAITRLDSVDRCFQTEPTYLRVYPRSRQVHSTSNPTGAELNGLSLLDRAFSREGAS